MPLPPDMLSKAVQQHWGPLMAWVGVDSEVAEDVVQQTFMRLATLESPPDNLAAWLYTVSRNEARNQSLYAQRRRRRQRVAAVPESSTSDSVWASAEAAELSETLSRLPDELREVVVAKVWSDLTFDEIAILVDCSKATVWRRYESALGLLRKHYGVSCLTKIE